jgi:hypothetical protein
MSTEDFALRHNAAVPCKCPYIFIAWCMKQTDNFTFTFNKIPENIHKQQFRKKRYSFSKLKYFVIML